MMHGPVRSAGVAMVALCLAVPGLTQPVDGRAPSTRVQGRSKPPAATPTPVKARAAEPAVRALIGYVDARRRLRDAMPTGRGVVMGHVEGEAGAYAPGLEGPDYRNVIFSHASGPSSASGHATATARFIYGDKGLAPGVEVVQCLTAGDFLGSKYLRADARGEGPVAQLGTSAAANPRVFTNSWIGDTSPAAARGALRRLDYQIDVHDVVVVAGVNNGRQTPVPQLLAGAYNAISVGTTTGQNSGGYTRGDEPTDGAGRTKPDLVAPRGLTSYTTPVVAACATMLVERADQLRAESAVMDAGRSEVIKAALVGGCTRPTTWAPDPGHALDAWMGAGVVNIDRSLRILRRGPLPVGEALARRFGWGWTTLAPAQTAAWDLTLPAAPGPVAITAVWNRRIDGRQATLKNNATGQTQPLWLDAPRVADFDLRLVAVNGEAGDGEETVIAVSDSRVDNVELIVAQGLTAGTYRIEIVRQGGEAEPPEGWEVALAWAIDLPSR